MLRNLLFFVFLVYSSFGLASGPDEKYFVFVGEKISLDVVPQQKGGLSLDSEYLANYRVISSVRGNYNANNIEFTAFDHYGEPAFSKYQYVLLYVILIDGRYYHSKYQYSPLYKTKSGKWAGTYDVSDYKHSYNKGTAIKPEKIDFSEPVVIDISSYKHKDVEKWFPEPYYKINGSKATAVYGNYIEELFLLKQGSVLKARGEFQ